METNKDLSEVTEQIVILQKLIKCVHVNFLTPFMTGNIVILQKLIKCVLVNF